MSEDPYISSVKEALIAEMLGDINQALLKTTELTIKLESAEKNMLETAKILTIAGEKYQKVINEFTEETKKDIETHIKHNSKSELLFSLEEYRKEIKKITTSFLNEAISQKLKNNTKTIEENIKRTNKIIFILLIFTTLSTVVSMIAGFLFINQYV